MGSPACVNSSTRMPRSSRGTCRRFSTSLKRALIHARQPEAVVKRDIQLLESIERQVAQDQGLEEFKFRTNREMLDAIAQRKGPVKIQES